MKEELLTSEETIEIIIDLLKNNKKNIKTNINKLIKNLSQTDKSLSKKIKDAYINKYENSSFLRSVNENIDRPVSGENLNLIKEEDLNFDNNEFIFQKNVDLLIENTYKEHKQKEKLLEYGLEPTKSILFHGAPGVGKTMTAKIIAKKNNLPLYILDLSTIMNSYLGKTGENIRKVFDFTMQKECVFLIDELDAIAKQRSDESEVGELKRLVTVLLQSIDNWPSTSILIAATNHPELLDRAVWRRFDHVLEFDLPDIKEIELIVSQKLKNISATELVLNTFNKSCIGLSHGLIKKELNKVLKDMIINKKNIDICLLENLSIRNKIIDRNERIIIADFFYKKKLLSQRKLSELLEISRDSIRRFNN
ncbi:AAA family ATPase [Halarcobacter bivalviorum]|uniref:AAA family ATPase n=1 Tax=Halarcobacter bivalviorum TaxID=663364 RepID=A0AAX2ABK7_9BACT|nr:ATP-binding protein [Halarcobacter bivalviorum]AXH12395.1 ATP-binding protein (AAA domain) [Halarcobacter bivalviorum]RXK10678.1 AAA family ATPase [Halarcobacter bivalviorum]